MTYFKAAILAIGLCIVLSTTVANSHYHHVVVPPISKTIGVPAGGSGSAALAVGFVGAVAVAVIWCANNQPKRGMRNDTWVDGRHDFYPSYKPRPDGCLFKGKKAKAVGGAKLWPFGK